MCISLIKNVKYIEFKFWWFTVLIVSFNNLNTPVQTHPDLRAVK